MIKVGSSLVRMRCIPMQKCQILTLSSRFDSGLYEYMECWRNCCKVTRMDIIPNEEVRSRMNSEKSAITLSKKHDIRQSEDNRWKEKITG